MLVSLFLNGYNTSTHLSKLSSQKTEIRQKSRNYTVLRPDLFHQPLQTASQHPTSGTPNSERGSHITIQTPPGGDGGLVTKVVSDFWDPMDCNLPGTSVHRTSQARIQSGLPFPPSGYLSNPGIKPGSPILQAGSLPTEPPTSVLFHCHFIYC